VPCISRAYTSRGRRYHYVSRDTNIALLLSTKRPIVAVLTYLNLTGLITWNSSCHMTSGLIVLLRLHSQGAPSAVV
jgi:hypothetical protein